MTKTDDASFYKDVVEGSNDKVVIAKFTAAWCAPCKAITPTLEKLIEDNNDVLVYTVDIDENPETAKLYSVRSIPTLIYFRNGYAVDTTVGNVTLATINKSVEKARNEQTDKAST